MAGKPRAKSVRLIENILKWSPRCREHFLPWRSASAGAMRDHYIAEAGISDLYPGYLLGRQAPRFHLLVYTLTGRGTVYTPDEQMQVERDSLLIVPARVTFGYQPLSGRWKFLWFHLRELEHWRRLAADKPNIRRTYLAEPLAAAMEGFLRESRRRDGGGRHIAELYAEIISVYIERELGTPLEEPEHSMHQRLHSLWEMVNKDLRAKWNVAHLAQEIGLSVPHLHRVCREHMHEAPMKVVTRLRMERAQELLILHDQPVRVIADLVGYQNEFAFFTAFRRFSGVTPTTFRRRR